MYGFVHWSWLEFFMIPTIACRKVEYDCPGCGGTHHGQEFSVEWLGLSVGLGFDDSEA